MIYNQQSEPPHLYSYEPLSRNPGITPDTCKPIKPSVCSPMHWRFLGRKWLLIFFLEAEYTFQRQKPIIPLKMELDYKPDGWLGILVGTKLFYDFSGKYNFRDKCNKLLREISGLKSQMNTFNIKSEIPKTVRRSTLLILCFMTSSRSRGGLAGSLKPPPRLRF